MHLINAIIHRQKKMKIAKNPNKKVKIMRITWHVLVLSMMVSSIASAADGLDTLFRSMFIGAIFASAGEEEPRGDKGSQLLDAVKKGDCDEVRTFLDDDSLPMEVALHDAIVHKRDGMEIRIY